MEFDPSKSRNKSTYRERSGNSSRSENLKGIVNMGVNLKSKGYQRKQSKNSKNSKKLNKLKQYLAQVEILNSHSGSQIHES